jgi:hypothetical protein
MNVAADPQQLLAHISCHDSLVYLTHMHNFVRNFIHISYILMVPYKIGKNLQNEGFNLRDKIKVCCEIITAYV